MFRRPFDLRTGLGRKQLEAVFDLPTNKGHKLHDQPIGAMLTPRKRVDTRNGGFIQRNMHRLGVNKFHVRQLSCQATEHSFSIDWDAQRRFQSLAR